MTLKITEAVSHLAALAGKQADAFDIVGGSSSSEGVSVFQGRLQNTEVSESVGVGIRIFKNGKPGYAHTERLTPEALALTLKDALSHTEFTEELPISLPKPATLPPLKELYNPELDHVSLETMKDFCIEAEKLAFESSPEVENIPYLGADKGKSLFIIANSEGVFYENRTNHIAVGLGAVAARGGDKKIGYYQQAGLDFSKFSASLLGGKAVEHATELLGAGPVPGGNLPVVFSERVAGSLVSMFSSSFLASAVQKGFSRLEGKLGKSIAASGFSLTDDPFREDLPGSQAFDSEGTLSQKIELVRDGVLTDYLYNLESALRAGAESNGCAVRSYSGKVETAFSNLIVAPGELPTSELLKLFPRCLFVVKLEGNSGCSAVSGEISIGAQGFLYENGNAVQAAEGFTLSTNFFDLLQNLVAVGSEYNEFFSSVKVPALAVSEIAVSS
ncbi:MAG: TldD/PmbA family protein [Fibrobacter sp.]|jgi:PmbA protein|nr:TldD/PmbA family protein [Fibrobacter sp.]